jgi:DNA-binding CsgD family transcriptional regulator
MAANLELTSNLVVKNCCRCGNEFSADGKDRVCPSCRKPKVNKREQLPRQLTFREKQIIDLVIRAKLNKEIAYELHLSEGTIKEYLHKVFRKLGVKSRTELAVWALVNGDGSGRREETATLGSSSRLAPCTELLGEQNRADDGLTTASPVIN